MLSVLSCAFSQLSSELAHAHNMVASTHANTSVLDSGGGVHKQTFLIKFSAVFLCVDFVIYKNE